ncbi:MAG: methyltransferase domain-containing protein [Alphaproteobacteria bacterium]|nr:methyltransferase domain-containing protein [Alphaproteobacteria bacterium]
MTTGPTLLFVTGMHRSGTSAITRCLSLLGLRLPAELVPARPHDNPTGFWEPWRLIALNDGILRHHGQTWKSNLTLPPGWQTQAPIAEIDGFLTTCAAAGGVVVLKDPRLSRTLPVFLARAEALALPTATILALRDPWEVAQSLVARGDMQHARACALWVRYMLEAEHATRGQRRAIIGYSALLEAPGAHLRAALAHLDLAHAITARTDDALTTFLRPDLRHQRRPSGAEAVGEPRSDALFAAIAALASNPDATPGLPDTLEPEVRRDCAPRSRLRPSSLPIAPPPAPVPRSPMSRLDPIAFFPSADQLDLREHPKFWNLDAVEFGETTVSLRGWALPWLGMLGQLDLDVNGIRFPIKTNGANLDYARVYPSYPNAAYAGFTLTLPNAAIGLPDRDELRFQPVPRNQFGTGASQYFPMYLKHQDLQGSIPNTAILDRIGSHGRLDYFMLGRTLYRAFDAAVQQNFGRALADYDRVVDWGCGSGRVARHMPATREGQSPLLGIDVDGEAVDWCTTHLPGEFLTCAVTPPLPLADEAVDLVYSYSVTTHLSHDDLIAWIAEIARVLRPGGVFLTTILSDAAVIALGSSIPADFVPTWRAAGLFDSVRNSQLDTIEVPKDYYRNVWITKQKAADLFGLAFNLVEYRSSFHYYQDLLVLSKRS